LIHLILHFLYTHLPPKQYILAGNESGLHLGKNDNLALNIAIYDKATVLKRGFRNQYFDIPPIAVIEVDAKTEGETPEETDSYYFRKIQKLLDFGVLEVIWIFSDTQKVIFASQNKDWLVMDWSKEILFLNQYSFSVKKLVEDEDINLFSNAVNPLTA
ncbi:MAG: Uma2 family endonuclease, partial [Verrucomicrobia bacterium]|nr:Uma2 family endonuclease [Cytophagales bacterium]